MPTSEELILKAKARNHRRIHPLPRPTAVQLMYLNRLALMFFRGNYKSRPTVQEAMKFCLIKPSKVEMKVFLNQYK